MKIRWHDGYWQVVDAKGNVLHESRSLDEEWEWMHAHPLRIAA